MAPRAARAASPPAAPVRPRALAAGARVALVSPASPGAEVESAVIAEEVVASGTADVVMSAREFLRDPHFALRAADELGVPYRELWPAQYERASRLRRVRS